MPTILLVADATWVKNDVHAALSLPGYTVHDHEDPRTLTDAVAELSPDLAVVDMQVANMGGMAMARSLKEASLAADFPAIPVILLLDRSVDSFLAKRAAADGWVQKPFDAAEIRAAVSSVLTGEPAAGT